MTDAFLFAANAVLPIVLMIAVGYILKRIKLFNQGFLDVGNKLTFRVLIPALLFYNIYGIGSFDEINFGFVLYGIIAIFAIFLAAMLITCLFTKDSAKRGALIQSAFRSNYAIIGLPLASALFGDKGAAAAGIMSAFCVPFFNILAVITLTVFNGRTEKSKIDVKNSFGDSEKSAYFSYGCGTAGFGDTRAFRELRYRLSLERYRIFVQDAGKSEVCMHSLCPVGFGR